MSGPRDKFDDGDLDELVHDFDLDMDAPLGASFAAALRSGEEEMTEYARDSLFGIGRGRLHHAAASRRQLRLRRPSHAV